MHANPCLSFKSIDDEYHHLLTFKDVIDENGTVVKNAMDDVKAFFALFVMAIYANVFDKRTYLPFIHSVNDPSPEEREQQKESNINAIPLLERRHYCYTRGLAFDLMFWFLNHYQFSQPMQEPEDEYAYGDILIPYTVELGCCIVEYKWEAQELKVPSAFTRLDLQDQVELALIGYKDMEDMYDSMEKSPPSFAFDFMNYTLTARDSTQELYAPITNFFDFGKTVADQRYFAAIEGQD